MPRYYFDVRDRDGLHRDLYGDEFDGLKEASQQAQDLVIGILSEETPNGEFFDVSCDVRDGAGEVVFRGRIVFQTA